MHFSPEIPKISIVSGLKSVKAVSKVWSNLLAGYQQARNAAKSMVKKMQLTSSLAHSMEENLLAWQSVAQRTEALLHAGAWDENPIKVVENLEENVFQKSDTLLYNRIPNANQASAQLNQSAGLGSRVSDGMKRTPPTRGGKYSSAPWASSP